MVSALDSRSSGPGSRPGRGHCVVFMGKTLYSHSASLRHFTLTVPLFRCTNGYRTGDNPAMD